MNFIYNSKKRILKKGGGRQCFAQNQPPPKEILLHQARILQRTTIISDNGDLSQNALQNAIIYVSGVGETLTNFVQAQCYTVNLLPVS